MRVENRRASLGVVAILLALFSSRCGGTGSSSSGNGGGGGGGATATVTVNYNQSQQTVDGFGASITWVAGDLPNFSSANQSAILDTLYATNSAGAGLSIIRAGSMLCNFSPSAGTYNWNDPLIQSEMSWMSRVKSTYGVNQFLVTTWSPPGYIKDNGTCANGGSVLAQDYQALSDMSVLWLQNAQASLGQEIGVWSVQNEPNFLANYDSASWTPAQFDSYVTGYLKPALQNASLTSKIMAPEPDCYLGGSSFDSNWGLPLLGNTAMQADLDILATHDYCNDSLNTPSQAAVQFGKPIWQTEVYFGTNYDGSMTDALAVAQSIYQALNQGNFNAWFYWWTMDFSTGNGGVISYSNSAWTYQVPKRAYAIGQFSRFMRPGAVVVTSTSSTSTLQTTAVRPVSGSVALVLTNTASQDVKVTITLSNLSSTPASVIPYRTSATENQLQLSPISVTGGTITVDVPANSIVTLAG